MGQFGFFIHLGLGLLLELLTGDSPFTRRISVCKKRFFIRRVTVTRFADNNIRIKKSSKSLFRRKTKWSRYYYWVRLSFCFLQFRLKLEKSKRIKPTEWGNSVFFIHLGLGLLLELLTEVSPLTLWKVEIISKEKKGSRKCLHFWEEEKQAENRRQLFLNKLNKCIQIYYSFMIRKSCWKKRLCFDELTRRKVEIILSNGINKSEF